MSSVFTGIIRKYIGKCTWYKGGMEIYDKEITRNIP